MIEIIRRFNENNNSDDNNELNEEIINEEGTQVGGVSQGIPPASSISVKNNSEEIDDEDDELE